MSVLSHLQNTADSIKIQDSERTAIDTSISSLSSKLYSYFDNIESKFVFGSYDRRTILRRSKDANSDVDYMVVFSDGSSWTPQTLMNRLKRFAEAKYSRSEIYQSSPTVVLELNHIKFELAPAYKNSWGTLYIPAPASDYSDWISTYPNTLKDALNEKNRNHQYLIRKLVRLMKYWNVNNGKVYSSYELEKYVIDKSFWLCSNLKEYFYSAVEGLDTWNLAQYKKDKVNRLKEIVTKTKYYEQNNMKISAESEIKKAIP
jgi:predicted nucleotidyltransferase